MAADGDAQASLTATTVTNFISVVPLPWLLRHLRQVVRRGVVAKPYS